MTGYNLEERTFAYARDCRLLVQKLPKTIANIEDSKQLVRSSGAVGANYLEGSERLTEKDFVIKLKISRKDVKESLYWLRLLKELNSQHKNAIEILLKEGDELRRILSAIIQKS